MSVVSNSRSTSNGVAAAWRRAGRIARTAAGLALVGPLWLATGSAGAAPQLFVSLDYQVDPDLEACPSEAEFRRTVSEQLGYDPFRAGARHRVLALAEAATPGIAGRLRWEDANGSVEGERVLTSATRDCAAHINEMAFAVVVQVQLFIATAPPESTPLPAPAGDSPARPTPRPPGPPPPPADASGSGRHPETLVPSPTSGRWSGMVGAGPMIAYGLSPKVNALGRFLGAVRYQAVSLELAAAASVPSHGRQTDGTGFVSHVALATLAPCLHARAFSGCAVGALGMMQVRGLGVDEVRSPSGLLLQAGIRGGVALELGRHVTCIPHAEALGTLTRWTVELNQIGVWSVPPVSVLAGIDVAYRF